MHFLLGITSALMVREQPKSNMAKNVFGDEIIDESPAQPSPAVNAFGDRIVGDVPSAITPLAPSPEAAFAQQYIAQQQQPLSKKLLSGAGTAAMLGPNLIKGLVETAIKGVQGYGEMVGGANNPIDAQLAGTQTVLEAGVRPAYDVLNAIRQAISFAVDEPKKAAIAASAITNPLGVSGLILNSLQSRTPSADEVSKAFQRDLANKAFADVRTTPLAPEVFGKANIPLAEALPLLIGAENIPGAIVSAGKAIPGVGGQSLRTLATMAATPRSVVRAARDAEPFLSGRAAATAESGLQSALSKEGALQNDIQQSLIKEQAAQQATQEGIGGLRLGAAGKGRTALKASRELQTAQGTITPEIVQAQQSIETAGQLPPVILASTADELPQFGRQIIASVEKPLKASEMAYTEKYTAVEKALASNQPELPAQALFDAAQAGKQDLSAGFEAFNRGKIKSIIDESSKLSESLPVGVSQDVEFAYKNAGQPVKRMMEKSYPGLLEQATANQIPKYTWTELQSRFRQVNQGINEALKYGNLNDARILGNLKDGIVKSMDSYAQQVGPDVKRLFDEANASYAAHQNKFGLDRIQTLFRDDVLQNPEMVAQKLISYDNPSQVEAIKKIVSPEEFATVQAQFSKKFFSPTPDVAFDPAHFVKQFSTPQARQTVKAVYGEAGLQQFNQINQAAQDFAKIGDLQKTLDNLALQSERSLNDFQKARGAVNEAQAFASAKAELKAQLKPFQEAELQSKISSVAKDVQDARKELDRVKNYSDLKDWATRFSGLNIVQASAKSPAWRQLSEYVAVHLGQSRSDTTIQEDVPNGNFPDEGSF